MIPECNTNSKKKYARETNLQTNRLTDKVTSRADHCSDSPCPVYWDPAAAPLDLMLKRCTWFLDEHFFQF